ncbi:SprT family zinc-dependent metalloprotease [Streptomyces sp. 4R-3d]|uniref:M48 family metallopeptidase n=1 Tax=Streptomyces sp. 4R-3d TaxID=2559605 RepID=UPI0010729AF4|nr:SprT family zinc-dependent metalloprotease [Streptomyces sp. 4R-3d]TFI23485.1 M48 family peptidase [Streptomyces sp. 4R-3d]
MTAIAEKHADSSWDALADVSLPGGASIDIDGFSLRVRAHPRRKRFALTVEPDATLTLHTPPDRTAEEAEDFVRTHRRWLVTKLGQRERTRSLHPSKHLADGEVFRYLGRTYRLAISDGSPDDGRVRLVAGRLVMAEHLAEHPPAGRAALVDWYARVGRAWAVNRFQPWAARMAVAEPELEVRDLQDRWGSYRPDARGGGPGLMALGWPLFQLPMHLVDYVIAHELAHVQVPDHGDAFWRLLGLALPEYAARRAELDEVGRRMWMGDLH